MTGFFGVRVERRRVFYDWTLSAPTLRSQERTTSGMVILNQWLGTQGMLQCPVYLDAWTGPSLSD